MSISKYPSKIHLPQHNQGWETVLEFLVDKFPAIDKSVWQQRMLAGKVHWQNGDLIQQQTPYKSQQAVYYYREVSQEASIPFQETILYQDEHILIADKPHYLPVTPSGQQVNECLQNRLRQTTGVDELQALHRLDRDTAGLVMFSVNPDSRAQYHALFAERNINKLYHAIAQMKGKTKGKTTGQTDLVGRQWQIKNKIIKSTPSFLMTIDSTASDYNSHSKISCIEVLEDKALFELKPITGKTHQLRVHIASIGFPILNDKFYPTLLAKAVEDYQKPLQLLAKELSFIDPITGENRHFISSQNLKLN